MVRIRVTSQQVKNYQRGQERNDRIERNVQRIGKDFPPGLIPRGRGIYTTPEVIDPKDCDHYPESIYCGGNPFSNPFKKPLWVDVDWGINECGAFVSGAGTILGVKLPTHTAAYIRPECRQNYEESNKLPERQPEEDFQIDYRPQKQYRPSGFDPDDKVVVAIGKTHYNEVHEFIPDRDTYSSDPLAKGGWNIEGYFYTSMGVEAVTYPGTNLVLPYSQLRNGSTPRVSLADFRGTDYSRDFANEQANRYWRRGTTPTDNRQSRSYNLGMPFDMPYAFQQSLYNYSGNYQVASSGLNPYYSSMLYVGRFGDIFPNVEMPIVFQYFSGFGQSNVIGGTGYQTKAIYVLETRWLFCERLDKYPPKENPYRHPKPPRRKECCMQCCSTSQQQQNQNDALLRQILKIVKENQKRIGQFPTEITVFDSDENKPEAQAQTITVNSISEIQRKTVDRVEKLAKIIGIDMLPITVPKTISSPVSDGFLDAVWDWMTPDETEKITSLFDWNYWFLRQFSAIVGDWATHFETDEEIPQDTSDLPPGTEAPPAKKRKVVLPDMAQTMREQMILSITTYKTLGLVLDVCLKTLTEGSSNAKEIAKCKLILREIEDFLDYPTDDASEAVPVQVSVPGADVTSEQDLNDLKKFLQPSKTYVKYQNWNGRNSLTDLFTHLATLVSNRGH